MPNIIADTSGLIVLDNIGLLHILKEIYRSIIISEEVALEFGRELPDWIIIKKVIDVKYLDLLSSFVDLGEATSIALATEIDDSVLILDDLKARKLANRLNIKLTGTIAVLIKARKTGLISSAEEVLNKLTNEGFRLSSELKNELLKQDN